MKNAKSLLQTVIESFATIPYPGDDRIVEPAASLDLERQQIAEQFRGRRWDDMPFEVLMEHGAALAYFTPEAYRYFLPAFILVAVTLYDDADTLPGDLVSSLTRPSSADHALLMQLISDAPGFVEAERSELQTMIDRIDQSDQSEQQFRDRMSGFSPAQVDAIRSTLEYLRDAHGDDFPILGPQEALDRYWSEA